MPMVRSFGGSLKSCTLKGTYAIPANATISSRHIPAPENGLFSVTVYGYNYGCVVLDSQAVWVAPNSGSLSVTNGYFTGPKVGDSATTAYVYEFT